MLDPTATPAMSSAESRPAIAASIVAFPITARLAMNSGQPSFSRLASEASGGDLPALSMVGQMLRASGRATNPDSQCLVEARAARYGVSQFPGPRRRGVVGARSPAVALQGNAAQPGVRRPLEPD